MRSKYDALKASQLLPHSTRFENTCFPEFLRTTHRLRISTLVTGLDGLGLFILVIDDKPDVLSIFGHILAVSRGRDTQQQTGDSPISVGRMTLQRSLP